MRLLLLALVTPARAEEPGGHFYLGVGAAGGAWLDGDQVNPGSALSVQLDREWRHFFLSAQLLAGNLNKTELSFDLVALKAHWVDDSPNVAPYAGLGAGFLYESHAPDVCFDPPCVTSAKGGAALTAEAGLLFLRARPNWHAALTVQLVEPLFKTGTLTLGFALLGARLSY